MSKYNKYIMIMTSNDIKSSRADKQTTSGHEVNDIIMNCK